MELEKLEPACSTAEANLIGKYARNVAVELPQDVAEALEKKWGDLAQHALQLLAVEGYRSGALTAEQLHQVLSLRTRT